MWPDGDWIPAVRIDEPNAEVRWHTFCQGGAGAYRLIAFDGHPSNPHVIRRVCGDDPSGTLYVGQTGELFARLSALVRSYVPGYIANVYEAFPPVMAAQYPHDALAITWQPVATAQDAKRREDDLLISYLQTFGELPPRNRQPGRRVLQAAVEPV